MRVVDNPDRWPIDVPGGARPWPPALIFPIPAFVEKPSLQGAEHVPPPYRIQVLDTYVSPLLAGARGHARCERCRTISRPSSPGHLRWFRGPCDKPCGVHSLQPLSRSSRQVHPLDLFLPDNMATRCTTSAQASRFSISFRPCRRSCPHCVAARSGRPWSPSFISRLALVWAGGSGDIPGVRPAVCPRRPATLTFPPPFSPRRAHWGCAYPLGNVASLPRPTPVRAPAPETHPITRPGDPF